MGDAGHLCQGHPAHHGADLLELPRRQPCSCRSWISARAKARCEAARTARRWSPGNAEQSRLYRAVAHLDAIKMPMQGDKLKPAEIAAFKTWIDQGAMWDAAAPTAAAAAPAANPLAALENDGRSRPSSATTGRSSCRCRRRRRSWPTEVSRTRSIGSSRQERVERNLTAAPRADKLTLVRRAYLDLLGLPPTPAQVAAFVADQTRRGVGTADRQAARVAALRRALRPSLARRGALRRLRGIRVRRASPQRVAVSRLRHQVVQRGQALQPVPDRADRRRRDGLQDRTKR